MPPLAMADFKRSEIALVAAGASADALGSGLDKLSQSQVAGVVETFPCPVFKHEFVRSCAKVVGRYPQGATRSFMRNIGEREVASFRVNHICYAIERAPFAE